MRAIVILFACLGCMTGCKEQTHNEGNSSAGIAAATVMPAATPVADKGGGKTYIDPVCKMGYDTSWTDMTVYENDTVKFCSENCKMAFMARPAKYVGKTK